MRCHIRKWGMNMMLGGMIAFPPFLAAAEVKARARAVTITGSSAEVEYEANVAAGDEVVIEITPTNNLPGIVDTMSVTPLPSRVRTTAAVTGATPAPPRLFLTFDAPHEGVRIRFPDPSISAAPSYVVETLSSEPMGALETRIRPQLTVRNGSPMSWDDATIQWVVGGIRLSQGPVDAGAGQGVVVAVDRVEKVQKPELLFQLWVEESDFAKIPGSEEEVATATYRMPFLKGWPADLTIPGPIQFYVQGRRIGSIPMAGLNAADQNTRFLELIQRPLVRVATPSSETRPVRRRVVSQVDYSALREEAGAILGSLVLTFANQYEPAPVFFQPASGRPVDLSAGLDMKGARTNSALVLTIGSGQKTADFAKKQIPVFEETLRDFPRPGNPQIEPLRAILAAALERYRALHLILRQVERTRAIVLEEMYVAADNGELAQVVRGRNGLFQIDKLRDEVVNTFNARARDHLPLPDELAGEVEALLEGVKNSLLDETAVDPPAPVPVPAHLPAPPLPEPVRPRERGPTPAPPKPKTDRPSP